MLHPPADLSKTDERLSRLLRFAEDVLAICDDLGIDSLLDGSLAVRVHSGDPSLSVRDVDLNIPEAEFPRLVTALESAGIGCELKPWHVVQARRDDLKVEFGAMEHWMKNIDGPHESLQISARQVRMVSIESLRELYRRGIDATAGIPEQQVKHNEMAAKLRALDGDR